MSCCGYHTLQWYYTYPSNPYKYVAVAQPQVPKPMVVREAYDPPKPNSSWYDLNMGWYNRPAR